jgi:CheY-like chemotaxis protein
MTKATVLIADNSPDYSRSLAALLELEGYEVVLAANLTEARKLLEQGGIDLAILDLRLSADDNAHDYSGLDLAREIAPSITKIILTAYPSFEAAREALKIHSDGLPVAADFVTKAAGPEAILSSIQRSVAVGLQLEKDFEETRKQAVFTHRARLVLIIVGGVVILGGALGVLLGQTAAGSLSIVSGVIVEALAGLFLKLSEDANKRMDRYHKELLNLYKEGK